MKKHLLPILCGVSILFNVILLCVVIKNEPLEYDTSAVYEFFDGVPNKYEFKTVDTQVAASLAQNAWASRLKDEAGKLYEPISGEGIEVRHYYKLDIWRVNGTTPAGENQKVPCAWITSSGKVMAVYYTSADAEGSAI